MDSNKDNEKVEITMDDAIGAIIIGGILVFFLFPLLVPLGIILFIGVTGGFMFWRWWSRYNSVNRTFISKSNILKVARRYK